MTVTSHKPNSHTQLYEQDFSLWLDETVKVLREGDLGALDIENLIEEIECMGNCYLGARKLASVETGVAIAIFPLVIPFTIEQVLGDSQKIIDPLFTLEITGIAHSYSSNFLK